MNIKKPNSFARYGNDYVAPLTTIDQIVKPSGERYTGKEFELMSNVENVMFGENGCGKNLLNPTLQTTTQNGVTITNNGDGTYTLNGTATNDVLASFGTINLPSGNYKLIGCPGGGSESTFNIRIGKTQSSTYYGTEIGNGFNLIGDNYYTFGIFVASGCAFNDMKFKPMITTDLSATYNDFEPYVKSLKQLTNNMDLLWTNASPTSEFAPQTISLDLSNYKNIVVLSFENFTTEARRNKLHTDIVVKNTSSYLSCPNNEAAANTIRWRMCTVNDTSIIFGADDTGNANYCIPLKIWGIK